MLYPRNTEKSLDQELFRNPTSEYRGAPFWAWNCELEKNELLWQLEVLKTMGMGGAHMHVRTGMGTPYLSDEHMDLIKACVDKCRSDKMLAWLYDEDRWPSGAAGGYVTKDVQYRARHLLFTAVPYGQLDIASENTDSSARVQRSEKGTLLACYDVVLDKDGCLSSWKKIGEQDPAEGVKWYAYVETDLPNPWYNNQTYANTLDKATIRRFIEVTYERYLETVGDDFGGVVPAIFTDEPQFSRKQTLSFASEKKDIILPWTDDIPETFQATYAEDILSSLPELFWELPEGKISVVRYHYHDHIAERFAEAFADQCGAWCAEHNLMLTGHMMEEPTLLSQTAALGEAMRSYRGFQLPGIDMLCNRFEFTTAKQTQSAVHQFDRAGMVSELYGVTGWSFDFRGHKIQGDWQAALGVTVRVPHLSWVSMKGEAKRDYPASISYQSPWWQDYSYVENHFARVNTALTRGKALVRVGVIHPVESYWLHWGPAEQTYGIRSQMDEQFENITNWLLEGNIDFDFISESLLPQLCAEGSAPLAVGAMSYDTIVVPGCETLRSTTYERLEAFAKAGGKLVFLGNAPTLENAVPSERGKLLWEKSEKALFQQEALLNALDPVRIVDIRDSNGARTCNLLHQMRRDGDRTWLFIAHSRMPENVDIPVRQQIRIIVKGEYQAEIFDTITGDVYPADYEIRDGKTTIHAAMYDLDSMLLSLTKADASVQPSVSCAENPQAQARRVCEKAAADPDSVMTYIPDLVDYRLDEPNALLLDKAEFALDDGEFRPTMELLRADNVLRSELGWPSRMGHLAQPWTIAKEAPEHTVRLRFTFVSEKPFSGTHLALEDADIARVTLNGVQVSAAPDGWYVDKSIGTIPLPDLIAGENSITVELPFGRRTNVEWCYLLGQFGVKVQGTYRELTDLPEKVGFSDIVPQGLAYYTGNLHYDVPFETKGGAVTVVTPHYSGAALKIALDDAEAVTVAYPPYACSLGTPAAGAHTLHITLLNHRDNGFGPVHRADITNTWIGPNAWRTTGTAWSESYILKSVGVRTAPWILEEKV